MTQAEIVSLPVRRKARRDHWLVGPIAAMLRVLGAGMFAGMLAGLLAIGVGGRIAMRISGALYERQHPGATFITESSDRPVGVITLEGTIELLSQGMLAGALGGLLYVMLRRWLPETPRARALASSVLTLLIAGTLVVDGSNDDFGRVGIPWLNVLMFGLLVLLFGYLVAPLAEWLLDVIQRRGQSSVRRVALAGTRIGAYCAGGLGLLITLQAMLIASIAGPIDFFGVIKNGDGFITVLLFIVILSLALPIPILNVLTSRFAVEATPSSISGFIAPRQAGFVRAGRRLLIFAACGGLVILLNAIFKILTA